MVTNTSGDPVPTESTGGTVDVGNLPAVQQVAGTVEVGNLPAAVRTVELAAVTLDAGQPEIELTSPTTRRCASRRARI